MNDIITVRGFVASEPKSSTTPGGTGTASFRLGSTERKFDRANNVWVDGNTNWFSVQAFRHLAGNIGCSVKKGQRVIVVGKLKLRQWEHDGKFYHAAEIVAEAVGHDLMWGSANFIRTSGSTSLQSTPAAPEAEPENPWPSADEDSEDGPHDDEDGNVAASRGVLLSAGEGEEPVLVDTATGELVDAAV
ncbi:single-stranded DNA-binding protein [Arthrobacter bambusae]|uniref:single-stranded DNA-binding protein n=1 Tax=Arthrobacter bambusae TaxID=1338426 RepID=UPI0027890ED8|nr:single-stranded DNA-binding protein [Arthrobacter bambusae]MDQ0030528.1 single-strand DNA-binding protein [Arthrobacter bambusae]MDQ0098445.1 single-strand DNA-binding protein [Arthrobacter bambusae]